MTYALCFVFVVTCAFCFVVATLVTCALCFVVVTLITCALYFVCYVNDLRILFCIFYINDLCAMYCSGAPWPRKFGNLCIRKNFGSRVTVSPTDRLTDRTTGAPI